MRQFTAKEYLKIDIANTFGLDRENWDPRLDWVNQRIDCLEDFIQEADDPYLFQAAVMALREVEKGNPTGHIMHLDATNSGLQVMACVSGCLKTAKLTNLVNTGKRESAYMHVCERMGLSLNPMNLKRVKKALMVYYYNKLTFEDYFDRDEEKKFFASCQNTFPGPELVKQGIGSLWDDTALFHTWELPDRHIAHKPVMVKRDVTLYDEEFGVRFGYRCSQHAPSDRSSSLCPDVIHSIDAWIVREMIRKCKAANIPLLPVHDSFGSSPVFMNQIRQFYLDILMELASTDIFSRILVNLGMTGKWTRISEDLPSLLKDAEYALC